MNYPKMTRADLRGKPLYDFCHKANRTTNETGPDDKRVFCYGIMDKMTDELVEQCKDCKAHVFYEN